MCDSESLVLKSKQSIPVKPQRKKLFTENCSLKTTPFQLFKFIS